LWVSSRQLADIDLHLPVVEARLTNVRNDQLLLDDWHQRKEQARWRWRELSDEAGVRVERRVQAAAAAPSIAGHQPPPPSLSDRWDWWSSAVDLEQSQLWEGEQQTEGSALERQNRSDRNLLDPAQWPDVADILVRVDEAEAELARRHQRDRDDAVWTTKGHASSYAVSWQPAQLGREHSVNRGPSVGS
jgi:hypothetical protein